MDIDIPVNQTARMGFSNFSVTPESVSVGNESNAMFGINNTGKVILYNVTAVFQSDYIKKATSYVGNIKPGETGNVDVMLSAVQATGDDNTIPVEIQYEDVNGNKHTEKTEINLTITEQEEMPAMDDMDKMDVQEPKSSFPLPLVGTVFTVAAAVAAMYFVKKNKGKKK